MQTKGTTTAAAQTECEPFDHGYELDNIEAELDRMHFGGSQPQHLPRWHRLMDRHEAVRAARGR